MNEIGIGEVVAQEPASGAEACPAESLRNDVEVFDLEQVARFCVLDPDRAGQRMAGFLILSLEIGGCRLGADLPVARIARLQDQLLPRRNLEDGRDVGVPAVMAGLRLVLETLAAVDPDLFDRSLPISN